MIFQKVNLSNIEALYDLNVELASDEGQKSLFTASKEAYADVFLAKEPIAGAYLLYKDDKAIGFYIYTHKLATYLASKVLYIEDAYVTKKHGDLATKQKLLEHAVELSSEEGCCRVELRVLKQFNFGYELIESLGFKPVNKWDVYRLDRF